MAQQIAFKCFCLPQPATDVALSTFLLLMRYVLALTSIARPEHYFSRFAELVIPYLSKKRVMEDCHRANGVNSTLIALQ